MTVPMRIVPTILVCLAGSALSQQQNLSEEITRLRRELMQVQDERTRTREEIGKDKKDFEEYRSRTLERMRAVRRETDSTRQVIRNEASKRDSLDGMVNGVKTRIRQTELTQDGFRKQLVRACDSVMTCAQVLPPTAREKAVAALDLLRNELTTKSVDNIESVTRLFQIATDMHETSNSIQIVQGTSPIPEIRGTAYRIRLGSAFEAVVNANGTMAAVWVGYDDAGNASWEQTTDVVVAADILKAVNVREGKSLPALVALPLNTITVVQGE